MTDAIFEAMVLSVKTAGVATLGCFPLAVLFAWLLARRQFAGKAILECLLYLPLVMPPVTTGYLLLMVTGPHSGLGKLLGRMGIQLAFTWEAAVIAAGLVSLPLAVRLIRTAFEMVDPELERAALLLGASPVRTFFTITVPLALPGMIGAGIIAFARALGEFGATITFAGNIPGITRTLPLAVFSALQVPGREQEAVILVGISIVISLIAVGVAEGLIRWHTKKGLLSC